MTFRRRNEFKTDYRRRKKVLMSKMPFIYIYESNRYVWAQVSVPAKEGDRTVAQANAKDIIKGGWQFSGKSYPAFYLVGILIGKRAVEKGVKEAILYSGLKAFRTNSKIMALVKGAVDGGLNVRVDESAFPSDELISGKSISAYASKLKEASYSGIQFSKVSGKIDSMGAIFNEIKGKVLSGELK
ncbi:MAG: 50S ribosomal protein L18 [Nitrososphaerota archaeon]|jgi:large subunit ribosomal protein L18|nr:50S ribosomal protein L18 [Nitrososphaerota archaeon]MDG6926895.1 50S ribosomal protein L18 [Nitrososphaerota archaeon]MDG6929987.1 50S ribosomal protein L18 [Nitrososphaerota archaeon]MDG6931938.1 50S ribosomal protein L18 [Nitrososphaerota archaeon]MDG6943859.1 50S ribosomal protein L18 [Nitrososphaerota archaeon]